MMPGRRNSIGNERGRQMSDNKYVTMKSIGSEFDLSSHQVGRILTAQGLREGGRPSAKAFNGNWVAQRFAHGYLELHLCLAL